MDLSAFGLNWTIQKVPVVVQKNKVSSYCNIVRSDNGFVLGSCPEKSKIQQNLEVAKSLIKKIGSKKFLAGTVDKNGRHVFFSFPNKDFTIPNGKLSCRFTVVHHHDGRNLPNEAFCSFEIDKDIFFHIFINSGKTPMEVLCQNECEGILIDILKMQDFHLTKEGVNDLVLFLMNPERKTVVSKRKLNSIKTLEKEIGSEKKAWDVFKKIVVYANRVKSSKDRKASLFTGDASSMVNRAFHYIKNVHLDE